jgi:ComF family protein
MLVGLQNFFKRILDTLLPPRSDFDVVRKLDENTIHALPRAPYVENMDWIHPLFHYKDDRVRAIIWELKYRENITPLDCIGAMLFEEIIAVISDIVLFDADAKFLLIPIPITATRRSERGYNQSELIARAIHSNDTEHTLLYAPQWLEKIKETPKQSRSESRDERVKNLIDSFKADDNVSAKYVILVDDVVTTGSTLSEARKTLLTCGAVDVQAFTIAH